MLISKALIAWVFLVSGSLLFLVVIVYFFEFTYSSLIAQDFYQVHFLICYLYFSLFLLLLYVFLPIYLLLSLLLYLRPRQSFPL